MFFYEPQALTLKILALFTVSKNQNPSSRYKNKLVPQYLYHHLKVSIPILFTFRWWWKYCANLFLSLGIYSCWMWKYWKFTKLFPGVLIIIAYCCHFSSYNIHNFFFCARFMMRDFILFILLVTKLLLWTDAIPYRPIL